MNERKFHKIYYLISKLQKLKTKNLSVCISTYEHGEKYKSMQDVNKNYLGVEQGLERGQDEERLLNLFFICLYNSGYSKHL